MIEKMKFLSISGPKDDIDRVVDQYLSRYEIHLENALSELKTVRDLRPFTENNPYRTEYQRAEELAAPFLTGSIPEPPSDMDAVSASAVIRELGSAGNPAEYRKRSEKSRAENSAGLFKQGPSFYRTRLQHRRIRSLNISSSVLDESPKNTMRSFLLLYTTPLTRFYFPAARPIIMSGSFTLCRTVWLTR